MPSRKTLSRNVVEKSNDVRNIISNDLRNALEFFGGFACTSDIWTDNFKRKSYLSIIAHYYLLIDGKIVSKVRIINMNTVNEEKRGINIFNEMVNIFSEFKITKTEIEGKITFVTDRGGNMISALADCKRINCYAHIMNNIVHHMCTFQDIKDIISRTAALVRYIKITGQNDNPLLRSSLKSYCETRFNTVVDMIDSVERSYDEIYELLREKQRLTKQTNLVSKITCLQHYDLKCIADCLRLFKEITIDIEGEKYETIHKIWPAYRKILKHLIRNEDDILIVKNMKEAGLKYIHSERNEKHIQPQPIHKLAAFLHPAFKNLSFCDVDEKGEIHDHTRLEIEATFDENANTSFNNTIESLATNEPRKNSSLFDEFLTADESQDDQVPAVSDEVEHYVKFSIGKV